MEQEALLIGAVQRIDILLVLARAERGDDQRLGFAAGEQSRAMGAGQHADLGQDRPDGGQVAPVDAALVVEDVPAHDFRLGVVERLGDLGCGKLRLGALGRERGKHLRLGRVDGGVALLLLGDRIGGAKIGLAHVQDRLFDRREIFRPEFARLLGGLFGEPDDRLKDRLEPGVAGHHRLQHHVLGELLSLRLDHQDRVRGARDDKIEGRILHLLDGRVDLDLAFDEADPRAADRAHEGHAGKRQRG